MTNDPLPLDLNEIGTVVAEEPRCRPLSAWQRSEEMRDEVILDAFIVMPNHLHGIVCLVPPEVGDVSPRGYDLNVGPNPLSTEKSPTDDITHDDVGTHGDASLHNRLNHIRREDGHPRRHANSLGLMIAGFKGAVTTRINQRRGTPGAPVWHAVSGRQKISGSRGGTAVPTPVGMAGVSSVHRTESNPLAPRSKSSCPLPGVKA